MSILKILKKAKDIKKLLEQDWYHGTTYTGNDPLKPSNSGVHGKGVYLTDSPKEASSYAVDIHNRDGAPNVHIFKAKTKNPYFVDHAAGENIYEKLGVEEDDDLINKLKSMGHDAIIARMDDTETYKKFKLDPSKAVGESYHLIPLDENAIQYKFKKSLKKSWEVKLKNKPGYHKVIDIHPPEMDSPDQSNHYELEGHGKVHQSHVEDMRPVQKLKKGQRGDWKSEGYRLEHKPEKGAHQIYAYAPDGSFAGRFNFIEWGKGPKRHLKSAWSGVETEHQRKGIANAAYSMVEKLSGLKVLPSDIQDEPGEKLWSQPNRPFGKSDLKKDNKINPFVDAANKYFSGQTNLLGGGDEVDVHDAGEYVVKVGKNLTKRGLIEGHLSEHGVYPPTKLIKHPQGDVIVQKKLDMNSVKPDNAKDIVWNNLGKMGYTDYDLSHRNVGMHEGKVVGFDAGKVIKNVPFTEQELSDITKKHVIDMTKSLGKSDLKKSDHTSKYDAKYPRVGEKVSGMDIIPKVDNLDSISASFDDHVSLEGIREFPMHELQTDPHKLFYAKNDHDHANRLAEKIKSSNKISPLIIAIDKEGPYVLEGAHRLAALHKLGAKSFPAHVVLDLTDGPHEPSEGLKKDLLPGGKGDNKLDAEFNPKALNQGTKHEMEHTQVPDIAKEVAKDHLAEDPKYYEKLQELEKAEKPPAKHGELHPTKPYIAKKHPSGQMAWYYNPVTAQAHDDYVKNNKQQFLSKFSPEHQPLVSDFIDKVLTSYTRHAVPAKDKPDGPDVPRIRHIRGLMMGDPNYSLQIHSPDAMSMTVHTRHGDDKRSSLFSFSKVLNKSADKEFDGGFYGKIGRSDKKAPEPSQAREGYNVDKDAQQGHMGHDSGTIRNDSERVRSVGGHSGKQGRGSEASGALSDRALKKDVGRITFPKIEPKITRPDQEVKQVTTNISADMVGSSIASKVSNYWNIPDLEKEKQKHKKYSKEIAESKNPSGASLAINDRHGRIKDVVTLSNAEHPALSEHEGLHHLVNLIAIKNNKKIEDIYGALNSHIHPKVEEILDNYFGDYKNKFMEKPTFLRDMLVHKDKREKLLSGLSEEKKKAIMTYARQSWRNMRSWAKNATLSDLEKSKVENTWEDSPAVTYTLPHDFEGNLKKDAGQIKVPNLESKFTRPEQQVLRIKTKDPYQEGKSKLYGNEAYPVPDRLGELGGEFVHDFSGQHKKPYAVVGTKASRSTEQHEGFHALTQELVKRHGMDKIHNLYNKLLKEAHPKVNELVEKVLRNNENYSRMEKHPNKRYQLAFLEEKINMIHDFVHGGKDEKGSSRRDQIFRVLGDIHKDEEAGKPGWFKSQTGFEDPIEFDNHLKSSWKRLRDRANKVKPEDLG